MKHFVLILFCLLAVPAFASPVDEAIATLQKASGVAATSPQTQQAWRRLAASPPAELPKVLAAMQGVEPTAQNWLRMAAGTIVQRAEQTGEALPQEALQAFLMDTTQSARGRRTAYEYLVAVDPAVKDQLIRQMLNDPSLELRYDAVQWHLTQAEAEESSDEQKKQLIETAFNSALNLSQLEACKKLLEELGEEVNLTQHMAFLTQWKVIGPFDNTDEQGFGVAYAPEEVVDLNRTYPGKTGPVAWQAAVAEGDLGKLDLTEPLGDEKGAVAYAYAAYIVSEDRESELRYTSPNATKVWLNGKLVYENEVYHSGDPLDQYRCPVRLKQGKNTVLVKVCQNEQTDPWAQVWELKLRFTDSLGKGLESASFPNSAVDVPSKDLRPGALE